MALTNAQRDRFNRANSEAMKVLDDSLNGELPCNSPTWRTGFKELRRKMSQYEGFKEWQAEHIAELEATSKKSLARVLKRPAKVRAPLHNCALGIAP